MFPYTWIHSTPLGSNTTRVARALETYQQITLFEQVQVGSLTLVQCAYQCLMNNNCITISYVGGICQLALN